MTNRLQNNDLYMRLGTHIQKEFKSYKQELQMVKSLLDYFLLKKHGSSHDMIKYSEFKELIQQNAFEDDDNKSGRSDDDQLYSLPDFIDLIIEQESDKIDIFENEAQEMYQQNMFRGCCCCKGIFKWLRNMQIEPMAKQILKDRRLQKQFEQSLNNQSNNIQVNQINEFSDQKISGSRLSVGTSDKYSKMSQVTDLSSFKKIENESFNLTSFVVGIVTSILETRQMIYLFSQFYCLYSIYFKSIEEKNRDRFSYKFSVIFMFFTLLSPYWISYSSMITIQLNQGKYEPSVIKYSTVFQKLSKVLFLTFLGPFLQLFSELIRLLGDLIGLIVLPFVCFKVEYQKEVINIFHNFSQDLIGLDLYTQKGVQELKATAAIFFQQIPNLILYSCILTGFISCPDLLQNKSDTISILLAFFTTIISLVINFMIKKIQASSMDELFSIFNLECMLAKINYIPFFHLFKQRKNNIYIDFSKLTAPVPYISNLTGIQIPFPFQFNSRTIQDLTQELNLWDEEVQEIENVHLKVSGACELITINQYLHFINQVNTEKFHIITKNLEMSLLMKNAREQRAFIPADKKSKKMIAYTPVGNPLLFVCAENEPIEQEQEWKLQAIFEKLMDEQEDDGANLSVNVKNRFNEPLILYAIKNRKLRTLRKIIQDPRSDLDLYQVGKNGETIIGTAFKYQIDIDLIHSLLELQKAQKNRGSTQKQRFSIFAKKTTNSDSEDEVTKSIFDEKVFEESREHKIEKTIDMMSFILKEFKKKSNFIGSDHYDLLKKLIFEDFEKFQISFLKNMFDLSNKQNLLNAINMNQSQMPSELSTQMEGAKGRGQNMNFNAKLRAASSADLGDSDMNQFSFTRFSNTLFRNILKFIASNRNDPEYFDFMVSITKSLNESGDSNTKFDILSFQDSKDRGILKLLCVDLKKKYKTINDLKEEIGKFIRNDMKIEEFKDILLKQQLQKDMNTEKFMLINNFSQTFIESFELQQWKDEETENAAINWAIRDIDNQARMNFVKKLLKYTDINQFEKKIKEEKVKQTQPKEIKECQKKQKQDAQVIPQQIISNDNEQVQNEQVQQFESVPEIQTNEKDEVLAEYVTQSKIKGKFVRFNDDPDEYVSNIQTIDVRDLKYYKKLNAGNQSQEKQIVLYELIQNFLVEVLSTIDLFTDAYIVYKFMQSWHVAWTCINLLTMVWPFFISQVPFITFQLEKFKEQQQKGQIERKQLSLITKIGWFLNLTPLLIIYMFVIDIFFMVISLTLTPLTILLKLCNQNSCSRKLIDLQDTIYQKVFAMQKMDILGFRRLRTISQFTFESIPQVLFQTYIYIRLMNDKQERRELDISVHAILISISSAFAHALIEYILIMIEKDACKTEVLHYIIICFNGRIGWVPFSNHFVSTTGKVESQINDFNYDNIHVKKCKIPFEIDFNFSDRTLLGLTKTLSNLPTESDPSKRINITIGNCLKFVKFDTLITFLNVAIQRVNIQMKDAKLDTLKDQSEKKRIQNLIEKNKIDMFFFVDNNFFQIFTVLQQYKFNFKSIKKNENTLLDKAIENQKNDVIATLISIDEKFITEELFKNRQCEKKTNVQYDYVNQLVKVGNVNVVKELLLNSKFVLPKIIQDFIFTKFAGSISNYDKYEAKNLFQYLYGSEIPQSNDQKLRQRIIDKINLQPFAQDMYIFADKTMLKAPTKVLMKFNKIRRMIIENQALADPKTQISLGEKESPLDISSITCDLDSLEILIKLMSDDHNQVGNLDYEKIAKLDLLMKQVGLDKERNIYYQRSRLNNQVQKLLKVRFYLKKFGPSNKNQSAKDSTEKRFRTLMSLDLPQDIINISKFAFKSQVTKKEEDNGGSTKILMHINSKQIGIVTQCLAKVKRGDIDYPSLVRTCFTEPEGQYAQRVNYTKDSNIFTPSDYIFTDLHSGMIQGGDKIEIFVQSEDQHLTEMQNGYVEMQFEIAYSAEKEKRVLKTMESLAKKMKDASEELASFNDDEKECKPDTNKIMKKDDQVNDDLSDNDHSILGDDYPFCENGHEMKVTFDEKYNDGRYSHVKTYNCNNCKKSGFKCSKGGLRCYQCLYDVCPKCSKNGFGGYYTIHQNTPQCKLEVMYKNNSRGGQCCNSCGSNINPHIGYLRCHNCDWDICRVCSYKFAGVKVLDKYCNKNRCNPPKRLVVTTGRDHYGWSCNKCRNRGSRTDPCLFCPSCQYDLCVECGKK